MCLSMKNTQVARLLAYVTGMVSGSRREAHSSRWNLLGGKGIRTPIC
jgi:hypothetical protein